MQYIGELPVAVRQIVAPCHPQAPTVPGPGPAKGSLPTVTTENGFPFLQTFIHFLA